MGQRALRAAAKALLLGLGAGAAALVAGCNMVESKRPWFGATEADHTTRFKPGIWRSECPPDTPATCARREIEVTASEFRLPPIRASVPAPPDMDVVSETQVSYLIAVGDPHILQVRMRAPPRFQREPGANTILYLGVDPSERDADGQVVAAQIWVLVCGPEPKEGDANFGLQDEQGSVTNHPFEGLTMTDGFNCAAKDRSTLMRVARETKTMKGALLPVRWVAPAPPAKSAAPSGASTPP